MIRMNQLKALCFLFLGCNLYDHARAADILPVGSLDTTSTGKVSATKLLKAGELKGASQYEGGAQLLTADRSASEASGLKKLGDQKLIKSVHRMGLFVGYGITSRIEFNLGLRGSSEALNSSQRRDFLLDGSREGTVGSAGGFDGVVLSSKFDVFSIDNFKFASLLFYEGPAGEKAWQSFTRSEKDKYGFAVLGSYAIKSLGLVSANIGYRSRKAEEVGAIYIGNEIYTKLSGLYYITPRVGAFLSWDRRSIRVADETKPQANGYLDYRSQVESASEVGVTAYIYKNYRLTAYVGGNVSPKATFASPEKTFGLSLVIPLRSGDSVASEVVHKAKIPEPERDQPSKEEAAQVQVQVDAKPSQPKPALTEEKIPAPQQESGEYPEMDMGAKTVDEGIESTDDFSEVKKAVQASSQVVDPMASKENELQKIEQKEAETAARSKAKEEKRKQEAAKLYAVQQKKKAALDGEVQLKADRASRPYVVTDKDVEFKGIDE
ncbi:MAG: hypothetical protein WCI18_16350 [Pseudomonadota bacterium]